MFFFFFSLEFGSLHHSAALCECRWDSAGRGQKMSSFIGPDSSFWAATIRLFWRSPAPSALPSSWMFCGVMGSATGLCRREKPNWSVFLNVANSCHHNKVRPWSCCCDPTKHTTERFMQAHWQTSPLFLFCCPWLSTPFFSVVSSLPTSFFGFLLALPYIFSITLINSMHHKKKIK